MEWINSWIECILATIILVGLIEIIVPEGELRKFVFLITGVIVSIVIATPIIKFFSKDFSLNDIFAVDVIENDFYYIDTMRSTVDRQSEILEEVFSTNVVNQFNNTYVDMKISECKISFSHDADGKIIEIKEIFIMPNGKVDDILLLKRRVSEICEVSITKVRVG